MLEIRQDLARTSVRKYTAMQNAMGTGDRIRGLLQFYGANRTGRHSSKIVQIQNLPQNHLPDLSLVRQLLLNGDYDLIEMLYGSPTDVLSQLIRTAFIPSPGCRFIIADFSAVEARVLAWLAGEEWVLETFRSGGGIYEATAARMYGVPVETIVKEHANYEYRQKGKQATLSCGYGGGVGALKAMGAKMTESEMRDLVLAWRDANPNIVKFWNATEKAALEAVRDRTTVRSGHITFSFLDNTMFITLPSGRRLAYANPRIEPDEQYGKDGLTYSGFEQQNWGRLRTYGGKLAENITQATARDLLAEAMLRVDQAGYPIVMHVHDEIVTEKEHGRGSTIELCQIVASPPDWADGLPLNADGFETEFYKKS
ncbi:MAG TPA: DNA-directed DNA polymerase [Clostridiales bacterium]|nr:DNA-directed DNA polymerase [Clostridiales bacterium]